MKKLTAKQIEALLGVLDATAAVLIEKNIDNELVHLIEKEKKELIDNLNNGGKKPPKYSKKIRIDEIEKYLNTYHVIAKFGNDIIAMPSLLDIDGKKLKLKFFYRKEK